MKTKRDYSKCFLCSSTNLWTEPKLAFCLECNKNVYKGIGRGKIVNYNQHSKYNGYKHSKNECNFTDCCHHLGKKDYFSICFSCYSKVPLTDDLTRPLTETDPVNILKSRIIPGKYHKVVDWNWIIEKQKELEMIKK
jgi:hypothetical protein